MNLTTAKNGIFHNSFPSLTRVLALISLLLFSSLSVVAITSSSASSPNLLVTTQSQNGSTITGYWVVVETTSGSTVQTGFSPAQFALAPGNYLVGVGDYGGEFFSHWSDGTTNRLHPISIASSGSVTMTAIYSTTQGGGTNGSAITVNSVYANGSSVSGLYVTLSQNGATTASGFTPATFSVTSGQTYSVTAEDYTNAYFNHWSNGDGARTISVTATSSDTSLSAIYTQTPQSQPPTGNSITVLGTTLNGSTINGIFVDLRINGNHIASEFTPVTFNNLQLGVQYGIVVYWYGNYYIRYINDSNTGIDLQRYDLVTLSQSHPSDTLNSIFEYVPPSQAANLNIIAEFPNGTQLGTASVVNGYDLHTPGMWLTLTPPFQSTPYTGTFTGGSILPFTLFNHETYIVQMSSGYDGPWTGNPGYGQVVQITFSHWQDNNSTDPNRAITLDGNAQYIAIYDQT